MSVRYGTKVEVLFDKERICKLCPFCRESFVEGKIDNHIDVGSYCLLNGSEIEDESDPVETANNCVLELIGD